MDVHEGTVKSLVRALARGDLSTVEECAVALASGGSVHADYRDEPMWPRQRLLIAWRYALPPYHRNPTRRTIVEQRTREQRLVGCFVELVLKGTSDLDTVDVAGTIVSDNGDSWVLQAKVKSQHSQARVTVPMSVPLDAIAACRIIVNPEQLKMRPAPATYRGSSEDYYLGLPDWPWFAPNQECGLVGQLSS